MRISVRLEGSLSDVRYPPEEVQQRFSKFLDEVGAEGAEHYANMKVEMTLSLQEALVKVYDVIDSLIKAGVPAEQSSFFGSTAKKGYTYPGEFSMKEWITVVFDIREEKDRQLVYAALRTLRANGIHFEHKEGRGYYRWSINESLSTFSVIVE